MHSFAATLITGAIAFVATNVDDIVILTLFFSRTRQRWPIIAGQYLGFSVLIAISLAGFFGGLILVRLLGLVPVAVGIKKLLATRDDHIR
jgi:cadmium resistance protein CadD (predicted permease)